MKIKELNIEMDDRVDNENIDKIAKEILEHPMAQLLPKEIMNSVLTEQLDGIVKGNFIEVCVKFVDRKDKPIENTEEGAEELDKRLSTLSTDNKLELFKIACDGLLYLNFKFDYVFSVVMINTYISSFVRILKIPDSHREDIIVISNKRLVDFTRESKMVDLIKGVTEYSKNVEDPCLDSNDTKGTQ